VFYLECKLRSQCLALLKNLNKSVNRSLNSEDSNPPAPESKHAGRVRVRVRVPQVLSTSTSTKSHASQECNGYDSGFAQHQKVRLRLTVKRSLSRKLQGGRKRSLHFEDGLHAAVFLMSKDVVSFHTLRRIEAVSDHKIELHLSVDHSLSQLIHVVPGRTAARAVG
jgi:hypothetical protein